MSILAAISDTPAMPRLNQGNQKAEKPLINPSPQLAKPPEERRATNRKAVFYPPSSKKAPTGIKGFDEITRGGLPRGRTTLIEGAAGTGKTIMALQCLANGARFYNEPGIFVAFEESPQRIIDNAQTFGWHLPTLQNKTLFFLDAQPKQDVVVAGTFDLAGMLAVLTAKVHQTKARRIVFDALDVILALLNDPIAQRQETNRLNQWLMDNRLTGIITAKPPGHEANAPNRPELGFIQFMLDCSITLTNDLIRASSQRTLRITKYRGSSYAENPAPFLIRTSGLEVTSSLKTPATKLVSPTERISTGIERLDTMLSGGYYRGASVLITGFPGTAKSTLGAAFAEAACRRGEHTLFVRFDSDADDQIRNLASVNIHLKRYVKNGSLILHSTQSNCNCSEIHLMDIKNLAQEHGTRCLIIDPVSALIGAASTETGRSMAEHLVDWTKATGITLICTSLSNDSQHETERQALQLSTLADTWIHLNYMINAGERNRGLSILKSRGTAHSNQVRELLLSNSGITLADAYTAGGEVLMGTMRWEKEQARNAGQKESAAVAQHKQAILDTKEAELQARLQTLQHELEVNHTEKLALTLQGANLAGTLNKDHTRLSILRGVDKE
jgi:circadian clock protein KaiC